MRTIRIGRAAKVLSAAIAACNLLHAQPVVAAGFSVTPLVSNQYVENGNPADGQLVNPWGVAFSPTSPFWLNDNGTGLSTLYNSTGSKLGLVVTIPPPAGQPGPSAPDGMVFNGTTDFNVTVAGVTKPAAFIFATEDGTISAWAGGPVATLEVDRSHQHAVYKGLALLSTAAGNFLLATDFRNRAIDIFDGDFNLLETFTPFDVPRKYAPFGIAVLNGKIYVTFAIQNAQKHDDVAGPGHGFVEVIDPSQGLFTMPLIQHGALNSPWGLAIAPASFGSFAGDLLVGNFGNGWINVYNPSTGAQVGTLTNTTGAPIAIDGLWAITPGNDHAAGSSQDIYFTAGPNGETNGVFGSISPSP